MKKIKILLLPILIVSFMIPISQQLFKYGVCKYQSDIGIPCYDCINKPGKS